MKKEIYSFFDIDYDFYKNNNQNITEKEIKKKIKENEAEISELNNKIDELKSILGQAFTMKKKASDGESVKLFSGFAGYIKLTNHRDKLVEQNLNLLKSLNSGMY